MPITCFLKHLIAAGGQYWGTRIGIVAESLMLSISCQLLGEHLVTNTRWSFKCLCSSLPRKYVSKDVYYS